MKVKICGIRTLEEARWSIDSGADFLGFNFYPPSPRSISVEECRRITRFLRRESPSTVLVGVFVNQPAHQVLETLEYCELDLAQLSGDEALEEQFLLGERAYKALRLPQGAQAITLDRHFYLRNTPPAFLVDASLPGQYGGTGHPTDWKLAAWLAAQHPIFLAGGLTPDNVAQAIREVRPWGVDVASGVEAEPGKKERSKIEAFIRNAHRAFAALRES
ncbi:MAG: phosphoribosylanthranilate isomerase [Anaerolineales bacterium]|nr:phosphoribosylanthranilate isomerase [Anaerolineales bacterium]MCS7246708.1 phosphoribosylanthranilate isomerase [Anaerolineales bacterium]MDW8160518.1 phosphoribosylanthranilate isomerase [Anaerolineales bacterium]MDW8446523.1 phosphoribosylanthranilate isomerase [Anaerolineales bacterium]